ncbi:hypothetical protein RJT34_28468 [Clitoria ternatea]|uniref:Transmembrane protein n=1 Tax=Clitoria ternatea TaxID=43366 RepID=A0AAN9F8T1_CLITE
MEPEWNRCRLTRQAQTNQRHFDGNARRTWLHTVRDSAFVMSLVCFHSFLRAVTWTVLLIVTVTLASVAPGLAFVLATSPSSPFLKSCIGDFVGIPLDFPREIVCLPEHVVITTSHLDFFLPTLFAALVVAASTCLLRSLA